MIKRREMLSVTLATIIALTVVSGAGVMKTMAQGALPTSDQIANAWDCSNLGWTFSPSITTSGDFGMAEISLGGESGSVNDNYVLLSVSTIDLDSTSSATAQIQTTAPGPGQVTFRWLCDFLDNSKFEFLVDGVVKWTGTESNPFDWADSPAITVSGGDVLTWRLTTTAPGTDRANAWERLDNLRWNAAPTADAGSPQTAVVRSAVTLDGSASSGPNSKTLTYAWSLISKPVDSTLQFSSTDVKPTFTPDRVGTYTFQLVVNDGQVNSAPSTVTITVVPSKTTVVQDLQSVQATIVKLDSSNFVTKKAQQGLTNDLYSAIKTVNAGQYSKSVTQLRATLAKTDGCAITGKPDKNDVIKTCDGQSQVYPELVYVIKELNTLQ